MESDRGKDTVQIYWRKSSQKASTVKMFELGEMRETFKTAHKPCSAILPYQNGSNITNHGLMYLKPDRPFSDDATYILVGGIGGLARYICSWMDECGAKHIAIVSRNGMKTAEAKETVDTLNASGASVTVMNPNASDCERIARVLVDVRKQRPIKGVIHLAMLLADAPMATMTGVKVDLSWILHE